MSEWQGARNLLIVRLDNIGDVVMLSPALMAIKKCSPSARITLLASPAGATAAPLLPWIDDVIVTRPVWQDVGGHIPFDPAREQRLIADIARRRFDAAIIFTSFSQTPHAPGYVCYLAGIPLRAGESKEFGGSVLTTELCGAPDELQQAERNLRLIEQLGFEVDDRRLEIFIPTDARSTAIELLAARGLQPGMPFVLLHPGASAQARRIPPERSQAIARALSECGWNVLVTGTAKEADLVSEVVGASTDRVFALVGATSLAEFAALVERASLVICGNTLPLHLADALSTPVLALYSGTDYEEQWRPRFTRSRLLRKETACSPCYRFDCPIGQPCLSIPIEEVVAAAEELLAEATVPAPIGGDAA